MIVRVETLKQLVEEWPFFLEGLEALKESIGSKMTPNRFFKLLLSIVSGDESAGCVFLGKSKNDKNAGYLAAIENTEPGCDKSLLVCAGYCRGQGQTFDTNSRMGLAMLEKWAKERGYVEIHAGSRRITGAAMRLFERKWGFKRASITFKRSI